jgi:hypothetical protein
VSCLPQILAFNKTCFLQKGCTKSDIAVAHETCDVDGLVCGKPGNLAASQEIPSYAGIPCIIADSEPACTAVTCIVDRYPLHILMMSFESSLDCQSIVMEDKDYVPLRIQQI